MAPITINGTIWDPVTGSTSSKVIPPTLSREERPHSLIQVATMSSPAPDIKPPPPTIAANAEETNHILLQAKSLMQREEKQELERLGVKFQAYVDVNTYLCRYERTDLTALRAKSYLKHVDVYHSFFKIHPGLWAGPVTEGVSTSDSTTADEDAPAEQTPHPAASDPITFSMSAKASYSSSPAMEYVDVIIQVFEDASLTTEQLVKDLRDKNILKTDTNTSLGKNMIFTTVARSRLAELASNDNVCVVCENEQETPDSNISRTVLNTPVYVTPTADTLGLMEIKCTGAGQIIHVADTGFDKGKFAGSDADVHPAFKDRVIALYTLPIGLPVPVKPGLLSDLDSHGTHVAGCAVGDGSTSSMGGIAAQGSGFIRGTAPAAKLICTKVFDASRKTITTSFKDIMDRPYRDGARVSNHSYGASPAAKPGGQIPYSAKSKEIDEYILDRQDLLVCWSAGNARKQEPNPPHQVGGSSVSKNVLTVGNSLNSRQINVTGAYKFDRTVTSEADTYQMSPTSNRGPSVEKRIKPDVCAPGEIVLSALSRGLPLGKVPTDTGPSTDFDHIFKSGTSMAAPQVAGCAAVLREALSHRGLQTPSAALLKVLLIHGAMDILSTAKPPVTNPQELQGFGRVNMGGTINAVLSDHQNGGYFDAPDFRNPNKKMDVVGNGGIQKFTLVVPKPKEVFRNGDTYGFTLKVTMTWMDRPGELLQNKLGLSVTAWVPQIDGAGKPMEDSAGTPIKKDERRHGNMNGDMTANPKTYDGINNVQQVVWEDVPEGNVHVAVECYDTNPSTDRVRYAVVWSLE